MTDRPQKVEAAARPPRRGQFPGAPPWIRNIALGIAAIFLMLMLGLTFPVWTTDMEFCERCPAVQRIDDVLGLRFDRELAPTPGSVLFDRVEGACPDHAWAASTLSRSLNQMPLRPGSSEVFELCARADVPNAPEIVHRLAQLSMDERNKTFWRIVLSLDFDTGTDEGALGWVAALVEERGWHDLDRR